MSDTDGATIDRLRGERWEAHASAPARALEALRHWLPKGQMLPEHIWRRRHQTIVWLLWLHVVGLTAFGLFQGQSRPAHAPRGQRAARAPRCVASSERVGMKLRVAAASFGLITASAMLVHLWGGVIEAHFHFFVMIGVLTLYQDWMPFLVAIGYVVLHHGVVGVIAPASRSTTTPTRSRIRGGGRSSTAGSCSPRAPRTSSPGARTRTSCCATRSPGLPSRLLFNNRLSRRARAPAAPPRPLRRGAVPRPRPLQGHQRQPRPPRRRQADRRGRRAPARTRCAGTRSSPASAATSSRSSARTSSTSRTRSPSASASCARSACRSTSRTATRSSVGQPRHRALPPIPTRTSRT